MKIMFFGPGNEFLKDIVTRLYPQHLFTFCSEVTSIYKTSFKDVVINDNYLLSDYDGFILSSTATVYNYLWMESHNRAWFNNPYDLRAATNHNFYFAIASTTRIKVSNAYPKFDGNKVSVVREFPDGYQCNFLLLQGGVIPLTTTDMPKNHIRSCRTFLRDVRAKYGIASFIVTDNFDFYLKEFTPIIDWSILPENKIKVVLDRILAATNYLKMSRR